MTDIEVKTVATTTEEGKPMATTDIKVSGNGGAGGPGSGGAGGAGGSGGGHGGEGGAGAGGKGGPGGDAKPEKEATGHNLREAISLGVQAAENKRLNTHLTILKIEEKIRDMVVYKFKDSSDETMLEAFIKFIDADR